MSRTMKRRRVRQLWWLSGILPLHGSFERRERLDLAIEMLDPSIAVNNVEMYGAANDTTRNSKRSAAQRFSAPSAGSGDTRSARRERHVRRVPRNRFHP